MRWIGGLVEATHRDSAQTESAGSEQRVQEGSNHEIPYFSDPGGWNGESSAEGDASPDVATLRRAKTKPHMMAQGSAQMSESSL